MPEESNGVPRPLWNGPGESSRMLKKGLLPDFRVRAMLKTKDLQVRRSRFSEFFSILLEGSGTPTNPPPQTYQRPYFRQGCAASGCKWSEYRAAHKP